MKNEEFKLRLVKNAECLIDTYYGENNIIDKLMNSTLKALVNTNTNKIGCFLDMFTDDEGNINAEQLIATYAQQFENGVEVDIKDYVKSDFLKGLLPAKKLIIKKDDIINIIK